MSSTRCQVGDGNFCYGGVLIIEDGWISKTHVVSRNTPENTLNRCWFNDYFTCSQRIGYFSTREDISSTRCQVGDGNFCYGGVLIIEDGWITKTHVVSRNTPDNTLNRRWFVGTLIRCPCICFNNVSLHRPEKFVKQLGLQKSDLIFTDWEPKKLKKRIQLSQHKGKDWKTTNENYKKWNNLWESRDKYSVLKTERGVSEEETDQVSSSQPLLPNDLNEDSQEEAYSVEESEEGDETPEETNQVVGTSSPDSVEGPTNLQENMSSENRDGIRTEENEDHPCATNNINGQGAIVGRRVRKTYPKDSNLTPMIFIQFHKDSPLINGFKSSFLHIDSSWFT
ncbi:hypothetical protein N665_0950s0001 [Sinapis alba]|nr:hypothetical protein N665_0950s0001 [Sinapis alba]